MEYTSKVYSQLSTKIVLQRQYLGNQDFKGFLLSHSAGSNGVSFRVLQMFVTTLHITFWNYVDKGMPI